VHCAFAGHPVVGDPVYGGLRKVDIGADQIARTALADLNERVASLHGQALHAFYLSFDHPRTGERLEFSAPPPAEMQGLLDRLRVLFARAAGDESQTNRAGTAT
jgi:23S rRNA pseudouridine1911/1915/1917 synthase